MRLLSLLSLFSVGAATYYKIGGESNAQLSDSNQLFETFLFPSAVWKEEPIDQECLDESQIQGELDTVPEWTYATNDAGAPYIQREFAFDDFRNAFLFMSQSAQLAEKNQHHPDWQNLYNTVTVKLSTDDVPCLGTFDFEFAQAMDILYQQFFMKKKNFVNGRSPYRMPLASSCTGPHEFCCEAPSGDPNNCPASARTDDCDKQGACCCA